MKTELACRLVDLNLIRMPVSLTLGYLQACAEADGRISGRCDFSTEVREMRNGLEPAWRGIQDMMAARSAARYAFAFTNYFWNRPSNLILAERIKAVLPEALIIFGGNDVTDQGQTMLGAESPIDVIVNGEGEFVFSNVLAAYLDKGRDFHDVKSVSFVAEDGQVVTTEPEPRIDKLDSIPSPFLNGVFSAEKLAAAPNVVYEFSRGCPFKCAFCFWGGATGAKTRRFSMERIKHDLDFIFAHLPRYFTMTLADANFGMFEADLEIAHYLPELVRKHRKFMLLAPGGWAKNTNKRVVEIAKVLHQHKLIGSVMLAAQSLDAETLAIAQRKNIPFGYYQKLQNDFRQHNIPTYTELILGMPGETYDTFRDGVGRVIAEGVVPVIYPLILLNNTEYNSPRMREQYRIQTRMVSSSPINPMKSEVVIGHSKLSYEEWLKGMALRSALQLFYCGCLKFVMTKLHDVHHVDYGKMLEQLAEYCRSERVQSFELFGRIFANHISTWGRLETFDDQLMQDDYGEVKEPMEALWALLVRDDARADALIAELAAMLAKPVGQDLSSDFEQWVGYQKLVRKAISDAAQGQATELDTTLEKDQLREYAGHNIAKESPDGMRRVQVRRAYKCQSLFMWTFRISRANIDTLTMFEECA